jgi:hypothetical protein
MPARLEATTVELEPVRLPMQVSADAPSRISVMVIISVAIYILPTLLAWTRQSSRRWRVTLINLLLGWTVVGWIVAMVLTFAYEPPPEGETDVPHLRPPGES